MLLANFNRKEHLRHRAVSLRQHGFLVFSYCQLAITDVIQFPAASINLSEGY